MKTPDYTSPFPAALDDGCQPHRQLARHVGCTEDDVHDAFGGIIPPEWISGGNDGGLASIKGSALAHNYAARKTEALIDALNGLSAEDYELFLHSGAVTKAQLRKTAEILSRDAENLNGIYQQHPRTGGKDPAAYAVASGVRRLFRQLRKEITYGQHHEGGLLNVIEN